MTAPGEGRTVSRRFAMATLTMALALSPGAASSAAENAPTDLNRPEGLTCETYETSEVANDPFAYGATAAISCPETEAEGFPELDYLTLFRFPDKRSMVEYWAFRSDQNPRMGRRADACADGKRGYGSWAHGAYFCYVSKSAGHALLRWTDERTNTYGVLDATNARLEPLHRYWVELRPDADSDAEPSPEPSPARFEAFEQDGLPTLLGRTTDDGLVVLRDEDFCAYLLGGIWGEGAVIMSDLVFAEGTDRQSIEQAVESYAQKPPTDEYALERCVLALNQSRLPWHGLSPLPYWAAENPVIPEVYAKLTEPVAGDNPED